MTDFPASKKTFSQIVDGTTYMEGGNINQTYDEVEAIQTFLGQLGSGNTQSYSASMLAFFKDYIKNAKVSYSDVEEITVGSGMILFEAGGKYRLRVNATDTDVNWTNIDTGAESNNTYYVYAVADTEATTFSISISLSSTLPAGATYYKKLGQFRNNTDIARFSVQDYNTETQIGSINPWAGMVLDVPIGWKLCDGDNDTPDLTDKFIVHADADSGGTNDVASTPDALFAHDHTTPDHLHTLHHNVTSGRVNLETAGASIVNKSTGYQDSSGAGTSGESGTGTLTTYALAYIMKVSHI